MQHQMQPTSNTCVCTCLAMLLDKPAREVIREWHPPFFETMELSLGEVLKAAGVVCIEPKTEERFGGLESHNIYLVTVPSLNVPGCFHQVIVDYRNPAQARVLDPAQGRPKARFYTLDNAPEDPLAFIMVSWIIDYIVLGVQK